MRLVIGLGGNLGDRLATLRGAVAATRLHFDVQAVSPLYETAPVGGAPQPAYLNAAMLLETNLVPELVLDRLLEIERSFGRVREERWGARTLDLDLLWIEGISVASAQLTVPHPELHRRRFALLPLLDLVPGATDPRTGLPYTLPEGEMRLYSDTL